MTVPVISRPIGPEQIESLSTEGQTWSRSLAPLKRIEPRCVLMGTGFDQPPVATCHPFQGEQLQGGEDDGDHDDSEGEGAFVGDGVDDGVFVEMAAGGEEPEAAEPEEEDGDQ